MKNWEKVVFWLAVICLAMWAMEWVRGKFAELTAQTDAKVNRLRADCVNVLEVAVAKALPAPTRPPGPVGFAGLDAEFLG